MGFTRRQALGVGGAVAAIGFPAIVRGQTLFTAYPFRLGVAAGDPAPDGFVIWTRLAPDPLAEHGGMPMAAVPVDWQVASDARFDQVVRSGTALAHPEWGHSVHVEVTGLQPDRPYFYRFTIGRERSLAGRARTAPLARAHVERVRIGVVGCQNYENGFYTAYRHVAEQDCDFLFHYGDYIYEGRDTPDRTDKRGAPVPIVREHVGQTLFDLADYRRRYAQYKLDPDLQAAHAACAWFPTFDDHEVENNWAGVHDQEGSPAEVFLFRRAQAFQAWWENSPVRMAQLPAGGAIPMARMARWGDLLDAHFLDTRQFRTDQPCGDNFKPVCAGVDDPHAQFMGEAQEATLARDMARERGRWTLIAQQVMMMTLDRRTWADEKQPLMNMDTWSAYAVPRRRVLDRFRGHDNLVVLTGDEHQNYAGLVLDDGKPAATEFVGTSITSGGDGSDLRPGSDVILANNPHLKFINDQRGYLLCEVTPDAWTTDFMVCDKVSVANATVSKRARWVVDPGAPNLRQA